MTIFGFRRQNLKTKAVAVAFSIAWLAGGVEPQTKDAQPGAATSSQLGVEASGCDRCHRPANPQPAVPARVNLDRAGPPGEPALVD